MNLYSLLNIAIASQGFLLAIFLLLKKNKAILLPLILFLWFASIDFAFQFLYSSQIILNFPHLIYVTEPFTVLRGVLIFMYVRNVYYGKPTLHQRDILLFIPFLGYLVYYSEFYILSSQQKIIDYQLLTQFGIAMPENLAEWAFELIVSLPFIFYAIALLKKFDHKVKNEYGNIEPFNYHIAQKALFGILAIFSFELFTILISLLGFQYANIYNSISYILTAILLYLIGYDALVRQTNNLNDRKPTIEPIEESLFSTNFTTEINQNENLKYKKNILSSEQSEIIIQKLKQAMETDKLYRNSEIRLAMLADTLQENANYVSQIINQKFGQNFYDFINAYRIDEAKERLKSPQYEHLTIEAIGYEVGFKSKSTFYTAFKKNTALTPIEFKNL